MDALLKKLNHRPGMTVTVLGAPRDLAPVVTRWKDDATVRSRLGGRAEFVVAFVTAADDVARRAAALADAVEGDGVLWMAYPKGSSSRYTTDINRDRGWEPLAERGFRPVRQVAIDDDWSALRFRRVEHVGTATTSTARTPAARRSAARQPAATPPAAKPTTKATKPAGKATTKATTKPAVAKPTTKATKPAVAKSTTKAATPAGKSTTKAPARRARPAPLPAEVRAHLDALPEPRRAMVAAVDEVIRAAAPGHPPVVGGSMYGNMIGYGPYHYRYASGREGDWWVVVLANQKQYVSVYLCAVVDGMYLAEANADRLQRADARRKVSVGKSCIRFKDVDDLDLDVLGELVGRAFREVEAGNFGM